MLDLKSSYGPEQAGPDSGAAALERSGNERSELPRSAKAAAPEGNEKISPTPPDPEVQAKPRRRRFSSAYKLRIVEEANSCSESGQIGALLRREGLYSSQLAHWRKLHRDGALKALADDSRGRPATRNPLQDENDRLKKQNARLMKKLEHAEAIIEIQKKLSALMNQGDKDDQ